MSLVAMRYAAARRIPRLVPSMARAARRAIACAPRASDRCAVVGSLAPSHGPCAALGLRRKSSVSSQQTSSPHPSEAFLNGTNSVYVEEMHRLWKHDPSSVHGSWDAFFRAVDEGAGPGAAFLAPPSLQPAVAPVAATAPEVASGSSMRLNHLIRAFQVRGHEMAQLDPLGMIDQSEAPELDYRTYGFTDADLDREFNLSGYGGMAGFMGRMQRAPLGQLMSQFRAAYCGTIGWEYMHIQSREVCNWLRERIEVKPPAFTKDEKSQILERTYYSDHFERFLAQKWSAAKRFGLEGCEALIPGMKACIDRSVELGTENLVIGMPHRGRLNVLSNVIRKPNELIFREFHGVVEDMAEADEAAADGHADKADWSSSGDVKYHLGTSYDRTYPDGKTIHISLLANPSHLEAVNPVVCGKVRAKQDIAGDTESRRSSMGMQLHGDAAFAGQGVVYETLMMAMLDNYTVGGTIHVVCNNQIGFTTLPSESRSSRYCSDVGKAFDIPVFHVNADDPEAVTRVFTLAAEYRARYGMDVIVDMVGYRRYGHNELDQPMFTQPEMYKKIKSHPSVAELYTQRLIEEGTFTEAETNEMSAGVYKLFEKAYDDAETYSAPELWLDSHWHGFKSPLQLSRIRGTGVERSTLDGVARALTEVPDGFSVHSNLKRQLTAKSKALEAGEHIDWATAEALAFGTLLLEGNAVRLSGQDVERGTFSQRHNILHDQHTFETLTPLDAMAEQGGARLAICNSPLSEYAVLGFELGYSMENPNQLVIWEAQFGDFSNGAQIIIDQFLSAGESKWLRQCGLVMLLPHGYDGQGPEHSSCRLERFLQMSDEDEDDIPPMDEDVRRQVQISNWQVCNITTPANYFHCLRRQLHRDFRKPLIIASPKALLRHKDATSSLSDFSEGTRFQRTIPDRGETISVADDDVERLIMCSGKVYYDLAKARAEAGLSNVAIMRVEQLSPFPFDKVADEMKRFPNATVVWAQEEPANMGGWTHVRPRIKAAAGHFHDKNIRVGFAGREASASPATGSHKIHLKEQESLVQNALYGTWDNSALHSPVLYVDKRQSKTERWHAAAKELE